VFPSVIDVGFVAGGQYGEGAPRVGGHAVGYYSTATGLIGWQAGAQPRAIIFLRFADRTSAIAKVGLRAVMLRWRG
jgi:lipid-binding SYLF domain-containing protein